MLGSPEQLSASLQACVGRYLCPAALARRAELIHPPLHKKGEYLFPKWLPKGCQHMNSDREAHFLDGKFEHLPPEHLGREVGPWRGHWWLKVQWVMLQLIPWCPQPLIPDLREVLHLCAVAVHLDTLGYNSVLGLGIQGILAP